MSATGPNGGRAGRRQALGFRDLDDRGAALTIVYEDAGDGWVTARIAEVPGAISEGDRAPMQRRTSSMRSGASWSWIGEHALSEPIEDTIAELVIAGEAARARASPARPRRGALRRQRASRIGSTTIPATAETRSTSGFLEVEAAGTAPASAEHLPMLLRAFPRSLISAAGSVVRGVRSRRHTLLKCPRPTEDPAVGVSPLVEAATRAAGARGTPHLLKRRGRTCGYCPHVSVSGRVLRGQPGVLGSLHRDDHAPRRS